MLKVSNLSVKNILNNINLSFEEGEITSIIGKNGSGKTTIVKSICSLIEFKGNINLNTKDISMVFQNPDIQFVKNIVEDDLAFGLENINLSKKEMQEKIKSFSKDFDISHLLNRSVSSLSGGEKQKIALISNLILDPKVLILDEAFEMLDARSKVKMMKFIKEIVKKKKIICINITHDNKILNFSDRVIAIKKGKVDFDKSIQDFYSSSSSLSYGFKKPLVNKISENCYDLEDLLCNLK